MREIRFRAWNNKTKRMIDPHKLTPLVLNKECIEMKGVFLPFHEDVELEQYIGFKDENGIEIYEGDVVEYEFDGHLCRGAIIYNKNGFWLKNGYIPYECKVIGNIHENPGILPDGNIPKASNS